MREDYWEQEARTSYHLVKTSCRSILRREIRSPSPLIAVRLLLVKRPCSASYPVAESGARATCDLASCLSPGGELFSGFQMHPQMPAEEPGERLQSRDRQRRSMHEILIASHDLKIRK